MAKAVAVAKRMDNNNNVVVFRMAKKKNVKS